MYKAVIFTRRTEQLIAENTHSWYIGTLECWARARMTQAQDCIIYCVETGEIKSWITGEPTVLRERIGRNMLNYSYKFMKGERE